MEYVYLVREEKDCNMGTLFNQIPRQERLGTSRVVAVGREVEEIAKELGITFNEAITLYLAVAKIDDYDTKDEQLAGLGELVQTLIEKVQYLNEK